MSPRIIVLLVSLVSRAGASYNQEDIQGVNVIKDRYPTKQHNVNFGTGYNSIKLQKTYNSAVNVTRHKLVKRSYIESTFRIMLCKSRDEFFDNMKGGVSASGSYMGVDASGSVAFLTETQITSLDSVLIVSVDAITDTELVTDVKYNKQSRALLDSGDYEGFVEMYGTHYLRKIILGGKMRMIMKFSSNTKEEKLNLDAKLDVSTGTFGAEGDFSKAMRAVHESSSLSVSSYAVGGNVDLPKPDVEACIKYALDFSKSVLTHSAVRELEYTALWTIPGTPDQFKRVILPLQAKTDEIVRLSVDLLNVESRIADMIALKDAELSYVCEEAWKKIEAVGAEATDLRTNLQNRFITSSVGEFGDIIQKFVGKSDFLGQEIDKLLKEEHGYDATKTMYLKSAGTGKFISTHIRGYPRLDKNSPIPIKMKDINGQNSKIIIGRNGYSYIESNTTPGKVLCMGKSNWYVFWVSRNRMYAPYCQWRLAHATSISEPHLDFGDRVIIYNRYWPNFIIGVDWKGKWLAATYDNESQNKKNQWVVVKT